MADEDYFRRYLNDVENDDVAISIALPSGASSDEDYLRRHLNDTSETAPTPYSFSPTTRWYVEVTSGSIFSTPIVITNYMMNGVNQGVVVIYVTYEDSKCYVRKVADGTLLWSKAADSFCYGRCQAVILQGETNHTVFFPSHDGRLWAMYSDGSNRWQVSNLYSREGGYVIYGYGTPLTPVAAGGSTNIVTVTGKAWHLNSFIRNSTVSGTNASVKITAGLGAGATLYEIKQVNPSNQSQLLLWNATFPAVDGTSRIQVVPKYTSDIDLQHAGTLTVQGGIDYILSCWFDNSITKTRCTDGLVVTYAVNFENNEPPPLIYNLGLGHDSAIFSSIEGIVRAVKVSDLTTEWTYTGTNGFDAFLVAATLDGNTLRIVANGRDNRCTVLLASTGVVAFQSADLSGDLDSAPCLLPQVDGTYKIFVCGDAGIATVLDSNMNILWQSPIDRLFNSTAVQFDTIIPKIIVCDMAQTASDPALLQGSAYVYNQTGDLLDVFNTVNGVEGIPYIGQPLGNGKYQWIVTTIDGLTQHGRITCYEFTPNA